MQPMKRQNQPIDKSGKVFNPAKPNFVKLRAGDFIEGIFLGTAHTLHGIAYKFQSLDKSEEIFSIGGGRAQLDQLFQEVMGNPKGFVGDTIIGHCIAIDRLEDTRAKVSGQQVNQYQLTHVVGKCPKKCKN